MTPEQLQFQINELRIELDKLKSASSIPFDVSEAFRERLIKAPVLPVRTDNVATPPTAAELNTAFGATPAQLGEGFSGLVDDNGSGASVWFVTTANGKWWYELLTAAA